MELLHAKCRPCTHAQIDVTCLSKLLANKCSTTLILLNR